MEECGICKQLIEDERYEEYGRCPDCYSNYVDCNECGEYLEYYLVFNNCFDYDFCGCCYTDQLCKKYDEDEIILCTKCHGCYGCCDKTCGKLKKDEVIRLIKHLNLPDDIINLIINFL